MKKVALFIFTFLLTALTCFGQTEEEYIGVWSFVDEELTLTLTIKADKNYEKLWDYDNNKKNNQLLDGTWEIQTDGSLKLITTYPLNQYVKYEYYILEDGKLIHKKDLGSDGRLYDINTWIETYTKTE